MEDIDNMRALTYVCVTIYKHKVDSVIERIHRRKSLGEKILNKLILVEILHIGDNKGNQSHS